MGRLLAAVGRRLAPREEHVRDWPRFALGAVAWCLLALLFFTIYAFIQWLLPPMPWWLGALVLGVLLKPLLSWRMLRDEDRKSTRLNSSHLVISYAVFCL